MTESIEINVDGDVHNISEYESYLSEEFQFGEKFEERPKDKTDKWILKIVPKRLFDEKNKTFYI